MIGAIWIAVLAERLPPLPRASGNPMGTAFGCP